jgi:hypothetical protein
LTDSALYVIEFPLAGELADTRSPVRRFFDSRISGGLRNVRGRYRHSKTALTVPPVRRTESDPGTVGTAADRLQWFLQHPSPALEIAADHSASRAWPAALGELAPAGPESRR